MASLIAPMAPLPELVLLPAGRRTARGVQREFQLLKITGFPLLKIVIPQEKTIWSGKFTLIVRKSKLWPL
ncbi:MAG TPA: hypothetical protein VFR70_07780 [Flavobacterium sp.]|nr:hypothetical protein [Flavobacterium sp.]